jgi:hypothetical protein
LCLDEFAPSTRSREQTLSLLPSHSPGELISGENTMPHIFKAPGAHCPIRGMGEYPSLLGEDFSLVGDVASRIQGKAWMVFSLGPLNPKPSALA